MLAQPTTLKHITLGIQLLVGIGLLTASFLVHEEADWSEPYLKAETSGQESVDSCPDLESQQVSIDSF